MFKETINHPNFFKEREREREVYYCYINLFNEEITLECGGELESQIDKSYLLIYLLQNSYILELVPLLFQ